jgi:hypothetical protein
MFDLQGRDLLGEIGSVTEKMDLVPFMQCFGEHDGGDVDTVKVMRYFANPYARHKYPPYLTVPFPLYRKLTW